MREIGLDTEVSNHVPFLATVAFNRDKVQLYRLDDLQDRSKKAYLFIKHICEDAHIVKVMHNATADMFWLQNIGIKVKNFECSLIASTFVNELLKAVKLKVLVKEYLGIVSKKDTILKRLITKYKKIAKAKGVEFTWDQLPREELEACALDDAWQALELWKLFKPSIQQYYDTYLFEKKICRVVVWMMNNRVLIDRPLCEKMYKLYMEKMKETYLQIQIYLKEQDYGKWDEINLHASAPYLREIIEHLHIETGKTAKGRVATDAKVLARHLSHPFVRLLFKYRFYAKHGITYYYGMLRRTTPDNWYAVFMAYQTGAKTGRFTYELFQTFPRMGESKKSEESHEVRKCVIPGKDRQIVCFDMDQEEARIFASVSNCQRMIRYFKTGVDVYKGAAIDIFEEDFCKQSEAMEKITRQISKRITLAKFFGLGVEKLLTSLTLELMETVDEQTWRKLDLTTKRGYEILQKYDLLYPEINTYMQMMIRKVYKQGGITLFLDSPRMHIYRFYHILREKAYISVNKIVQGSAAYVLKYAMLYTSQWIFKQKLQKWVQLIAVVHDELIFRMPLYDDKTEERDILLALKGACEDYDTFRVPLMCTVKKSDRSWGEVEKYEF